MKIQAIKRYIPRKLLGRAVLIFLLPIIFIELIVFVGFIQRHFAQVTNQMSESLTYEIRYIVSKIKGHSDKTQSATAIKKLGTDFGLELEFTQDQQTLKIINLEIFDFTGRAFVKRMRKNFRRSRESFFKY